MSGTPYLHELTIRLAMGAAGLDPSIKQLHGDWLAAKQEPDGGFAGREGASDPYYTAFALRGLWILDRLTPEIGHSAAQFLRARLSQRESMIDLISLVFAAAICELAVGEVVLPDEDLSDHRATDPSWRTNIVMLLDSLRTEDGGFAKTPEGRAGSTYQTFLSLLCLQLIDQPAKDPDAIVRFLQSQAHAEGGYREIRAAKRPGVNPTAAAIGSLSVLNLLEPGEQEATIDFLAEMQSDEGGMTANTRIPFADLLSTFTGLLTLADLDAVNEVDLERLSGYARSMQAPGGGFVGFTLDQTADVEYTFYGLATLSLCQLITP